MVRTIADTVLVHSWGTWLVILIEGADRLSVRAFDQLHHRLERQPSGMTFILTSAAPETLPDRVQNLFLPLPVRPLHRAERAHLVARVCDREGIAALPAAIECLAAHAGGRPRRLLRDLEVLTEAGQLAPTAIAAYYGLTQDAPAVGYVTQVLEGRPLLEQLDPLDRWEAEPGEKIAGIAAFLTRLFTAHLRAGALDRNAAATAHERTALDALYERARTLGSPPRDLFQAILSFWHPVASADAGQLLTRVSAFDTCLNGQARMARVDAGADTPVRQRRSALAGSRGDARGGARPDRLSQAHIRALWEAGSFLIQRFGVCLNARLSLHHSMLGCEPGAIGPFVSEVLHELGIRVAERTQAVGEPGKLHYLYVHETGPYGGRTHIAAHIPEVTGAVDFWFARRFGTARAGLHLRRWRTDTQAGAYARHLRLMALLCRSCEPNLRTPGRDGTRPLVARLGVPRRLRQPIGRSPCTQRYGVSRLIGPGARQTDVHGLPPLSAFADQAWDALTVGWELSEYAYRREVAAAYAAHRARLDDAWPDGGDALMQARRAIELARLESDWQAYAPHRRVQRPGWSAPHGATIASIDFPNGSHAYVLNGSKA